MLECITASTVRCTAVQQVQGLNMRRWLRAGYYVKGAQLLAAKPDFMCAPRDTGVVRALAWLLLSTSLA